MTNIKNIFNVLKIYDAQTSLFLLSQTVSIAVGDACRGALYVYSVATLVFLLEGALDLFPGCQRVYVLSPDVLWIV
jgi:hypothetical protein